VNAAAFTPCPLEALADMKAAARVRGLGYDAFRKGWRREVRERGFPAPVRDARPYLWRPSSLAAWQERAEAETRARILGAATGPDAAANQNDPGRQAAPSRQDRARLDVLALMTGAAR
jgi:hypothetical protein